jgi:hypothetical protein
VVVVVLELTALRLLQVVREVAVVVIPELALLEQELQVKEMMVDLHQALMAAVVAVRVVLEIVLPLQVVLREVRVVLEQKTLL